MASLHRLTGGTRQQRRGIWGRPPPSQMGRDEHEDEDISSLETVVDTCYFGNPVVFVLCLGEMKGSSPSFQPFDATTVPLAPGSRSIAFGRLPSGCFLSPLPCPVPGRKTDRRAGVGGWYPCLPKASAPGISSVGTREGFQIAAAACCCGFTASCFVDGDGGCFQIEGVVLRC